MVRWALNILAGLCLLLSAAITVLWVRSCWHTDEVRFVHRRPRAGTLYVLYSFRGRAAVVAATAQYRPDTYMSLFYSSYEARLRMCAGFYGVYWLPQPVGVCARAGFIYEVYERHPNLVETTLAAPYWALVFPLALPGVIWFAALLRSRRRYRTQHGLCVRCSYDLRASTERCPECGTPIPPNAPRLPLRE